MRIVILLLKLLSHLPFWVLWGIADLLYFVMYYLLKYRRTVVETNLANSFPEKTKEERTRIAKKFYRNLADYFVETLKLNTLSEKQVAKRVKIDDATLELFSNYYSEGRNIISLSGHIMNWEYCAFIPKMVGHKCLVTYKKLTNAHYDNFVKSIRERFGAAAVDFTQTYRTIKEHERAKVLTATWICNDQRPGAESNRVEIEFLNQSTQFYNGVEALARRTNSVVTFLEQYKTKRGYYRFELKLITDTPKQVADNFIIEKYAKNVERIVNEYPDNWLWTHKRWKK